MRCRCFSYALLLAVLLSVIASGCSSPNAPAREKQSLQSSPDEFTPDKLAFDSRYYSLSYPSDWAEKDADGLVAFSAPKSGADDKFLENVVVDVKPAQPGLTLDEHVEGAIEVLKGAIGDFNIVGISKVTLSGADARMLTYTGTLQGFSLAITQVLAIKDGLLYVITYNGERDYDRHLGQVGEIVSSFKIKSEPGATSGNTAPEQGAASPGTTPDATAEAVNENKEAGSLSLLENKLARTWMIYSEYIYYDAGGSNFLDTPSTRRLVLEADKTWSFGDSSGGWYVSKVTAADWEKWGVNDYGPTMKLTLDGWNKDTADGPIEESSGNIDFIWVIYRTGPPTTSEPGQVQIKFGNTN